MSYENIYPSAPGDLTEIDFQTPDSGEHWDKMVSRDGDASYIHTTSATWQNDLYLIDITDLQSGYERCSIDSVRIYTYVRGAGGGTPRSEGLFKTHGIVYPCGLEIQRTPAVYDTYYKTLTTNLHTGLPWTWDEMDNLQIGIRLREITGVYEVAASAVWIRVYYTPVAPIVTTQAVTEIAAATATGNGNVVDFGGDYVWQYGHCWSTSPNPTTSDSKNDKGWCYTPGPFTSNLTDLIPATKYYVRAYALTTNYDLGYGDEVEFTTPMAAPTVTTDEATLVEEETAVGNGNITDNGGEDCDKRGICWNTTGSPTVEDNKSEETDSFGTGAFSRPITGLSPGIKYYVKAYAHNSAGYGYGGEESFTTKPNAPSNLACVVQSSSQIDVDWIRGTGATRTMVRRKVGSYPSDVTDGDQAYYGNGTSFNDNPLVRATHYYYRAWSWVEGGDIWSDDYSEDNAWTLIGVPTVTTDTATGIAAALATLNGTLADDGGEACDCGFEWGQDVPYGNTTSTESRTMGQTFAQTITGLQPKTTYRFRAFATNSAGTSYGTIRTFTTPARLPTTTTNPATGTSALNGTLDDDGGEACDCGFEWGETDAYGETTPTQSRRTGQNVLQTIGELLPDTTYHFRASATNSRGTDYGADRSFTTPAALPTVTTNPATELGAIEANLNGTLDDDGGEACECGFEFGLDTGYGTSTSTESKTTSQTFSQVIGGLAPNTTYHFRAFATNSAGTSYGADMTFTTALVISRAFALAREEL